MDKIKATSKENTSNKAKEMPIYMKVHSLKKAFKNNETVEGYVKYVDKEYNLHVSLGNGVIGIVPRNEVSAVVNENTMLPDASQSMSKLHKLLQVKIKEIVKIDKNKVQFILSRKAVETEVRKWMYQNLKEGMILNGLVTNLESYGAFVDVGGGVVGLLHIENICLSRIESPSEFFKIGDKIKVVVKTFDRDTGKITLSHKELLGTWEDNVKGIKEGDTIEGLVRLRDKNGIFVQIKPNLMGLADHVAGIESGQKVIVYIKKIDMDKKKLKLVIIG